MGLVVVTLVAQSTAQGLVRQRGCDRTGREAAPLTAVWPGARSGTSLGLGLPVCGPHTRQDFSSQ